MKSPPAQKSDHDFKFTVKTNSVEYIEGRGFFGTDVARSSFALIIH